MTASDVFRRTVDALDRAGIPYMITGSFVSSFHGKPRSTRDIDIVISPTPDQLRLLFQFLPESEYYFDVDSALDAQRRESLFNIIDFATGWKVDFIIRKSRPFSREEFDRRTTVDFAGIRAVVATAEDVLIAKLEWAKMGQSDRQLEDAAGILAIQGNQLDQDYVLKWVRELHLNEEWETATKLAKT